MQEARTGQQRTLLLEGPRPPPAPLCSPPTGRSLSTSLAAWSESRSLAVADRTDLPSHDAVAQPATVPAPQLSGATYAPELSPRTARWNQFFLHLEAQIGSKNAEYIKATCTVERRHAASRYIGFRERGKPAAGDTEREEDKYLGVMLAEEPYTAYIGGSRVPYQRGSEEHVGLLTSIEFHAKGFKYMAHIITDKKQLILVELTHVGITPPDTELLRSEALTAVLKAVHKSDSKAPPAASQLQTGAKKRCNTPPLCDSLFPSISVCLLPLQKQGESSIEGAEEEEER